VKAARKAVSRRLVLLPSKNAFHSNLTEMQSVVGFPCPGLSACLAWGGAGREARCCAQAVLRLLASLSARSAALPAPAAVPNRAGRISTFCTRRYR